MSYIDDLLNSERARLTDRFRHFQENVEWHEAEIAKSIEVRDETARRIEDLDALIAQRDS